MFTFFLYTIRRVIQKGRGDGDIPPNGSWKRFIKSHIDSLFCCDFFTIETVFNKRLYIFFLMEMKTRKIVLFGITGNPTIQFIRNRLSGFMFDRDGEKTILIHDNSGELKWFDYESIGITGIAITPYSPKAGRKQASCSPMHPCINAHAERFVRSVKREYFDNFVVFNCTQLRNIMKEYVRYYNNLRPHQGIGNIVPENPKSIETGEIRKESALFGLYTNYYRSAS